MVTPKFLALVFPVRIGAAQQKCLCGEIGKRDGLKIHSQFGLPVRFRPKAQTDRADSRELKTMCYVKN